MPRPFPTVCALLLIPLTALAQPFDNSVFWDLGNAPTGQKTVYNWKPNGGSYGMPLLVGDWNGDGRGDLATTAMRVSSAGRSESGEIYVYFGDGNISGIINGASPAPGTQLIIQGAQSSAHLGSYLQTADFNGDGIEDLLLGAQNGDGPGGRNNCGSCWLIFGSTSLAAGTIDLAAPPAGVTAIFGRDINDRLGIWVDRGDFNGDHIADVMLAADQGDGPTNATSSCGEVWVLFGQTTWPASIDLAAPPPNALVVYGIDSGDHMGASIYGADLDNDGKDELLLGAGLNRLSAGLGGQATGGGNGPGESRPDCGEIYVVWGAASFPASIDLRTAPPADLTTIYGEYGGDCFGEEIDAGDLDGDGYQDLLGGALTAGPFGRGYGGALYVIYGGPALRGQFIDLRTAPGVAKVYGAASSDINGDTLTACDLNRDGLSDLVSASPGSTPVGRFGAGNVDVFYGSKVRLSGVIDLLSVPDTLPYRYVAGVDPGDTAAYSMASGNADNDNFVDLFINAMTADGFQNASGDAGEGYCVSGRVLSRGSTGVLSLPRIGTTLNLAIRVEPNAIYQAACSLARTPGIPLPGGGTLNLAPDTKFTLSVTPGGLGIFNNFAGAADALGRATPNIALPNIGTLAGLKLYFGYIGITGSTITTISQSLGIVLQS
jgi:hypothetical protein